MRVYVFENNACVRKETSVARVAHVLLLHSVAGNVEVNMPVSKCSEFEGGREEGGEGREG